MSPKAGCGGPIFGLFHSPFGHDRRVLGYAASRAGRAARASPKKTARVGEAGKVKTGMRIPAVTGPDRPLRSRALTRRESLGTAVTFSTFS